jgi:hypothetical protein
MSGSSYTTISLTIPYFNFIYDYFDEQEKNKDHPVSGACKFIMQMQQPTASDLLLFFSL